MTSMTHRRTFAESTTEIQVDVRTVRRLNAAHLGDTSTETVRRIYEFLTEHPEEFVDG